jgi:hypothetical protein
VEEKSLRVMAGSSNNMAGCTLGHTRLCPL